MPAAAVLGGFAFFVGVFAALLTSFYSWRLIFLTFCGKPRWAASEHIQHARARRITTIRPTSMATAAHDARRTPPDGTGGYHPHESPLDDAGAARRCCRSARSLAGMVFHDAFIDAEEGAHFWHGSIAFDDASGARHPRGAAAG